MTIPLVVAMTCAYSVALVAAIYFTRATSRRVGGALAGGAAAGAFGLGMMTLGEARGWWHIPHPPTPWFLPLLYLGLSISLAPIYLVTWRVARRFGWRGLMVCLAAITLLGAPRDYLYATMRPQWMVFGAGVTPFLADAAAYLGMVAIGHAVMRLVAGPASEDGLAERRKQGA